MRRLSDLLIATVLGLLLVPFLLMVAALVRVRLGSPVLFRQVRSGMAGREFTIVKFRTMRPEAYPGQPDPERLGRLGRGLRHASLDELPQLWNVLRGEMSLIGPRPTLPEQVRHYDARQRRRLEVRPGVTGWAQVNGRNSLTWPERIELDVWYVDNWCLRLDLLIVCRTLVSLVRPHGVTAEGGVNPGFPVPRAALDDVSSRTTTRNTAEG